MRHLMHNLEMIGVCSFGTKHFREARGGPISLIALTANHEK